MLCPSLAEELTQPSDSEKLTQLSDPETVDSRTDSPSATDPPSPSPLSPETIIINTNPSDFIVTRVKGSGSVQLSGRWILEDEHGHWLVRYLEKE